jgi:acylphosphatase
MNNLSSIKNERVRIIVKGYVQGVGYRYFIYKTAMEFDLKGFSKNLYNGDVEIEVEGRKEFLEELIKRARVGPSMARVDNIKVEWLEFKNKYDKFEVY